MDLTQQTIGKLRQMLDSKEISAPELTQGYLDRIAKYDDTIQSYITVTAERALADAAAAQKKLMWEMQACFAAFPWQSRTIFAQMASRPLVLQKCWKISFRRIMQL